MSQRTYIQVLLPLKLEWNPWYWTEEKVRVGQRVAVVFAHRQQVGVVLSVGGNPTIDPERIGQVTTVETGLPDVLPLELKLWQFVSDYYMCTLGEVYKAAYPSAKIRSEKVAVDHQRRAEETHLRMRIALEKKVATLEGRLTAKEKALSLREASTRSSKVVTDRLKAERDLIAEQLEAARKAVLAFDATLGNMTSSSSLNVAADVDQKSAMTTDKMASNLFVPGKPVLIHGTDRLPKYFEYVDAALKAGMDVLVLEPETDLGLNVEESFKARFGDKVRLFNAVMTAVQKRRVADELRAQHQPLVIIGLRSALFLPYSNLGLVIVDEEHDPSYKQTEPAPRYNGRDLAAVLASYAGAQLVLGSACPSLETLLNCMGRKYMTFECGCAGGEVEIVDVNAEKRKRGMIGDFSRKAISAIQQLVEECRRTSGGTPLITIVRCYRSEEDTLAQTNQLFPGLDPQILTAFAARKSTSHSALTLVMQADALFDREDFRADEKALQTLVQLRSHTDRLIVQTGTGAHPVFGTLSGEVTEAELLEERRQFNLPPYTRIVDVHSLATGELITREILQRDRTLAARKKELQEQYSKTAWFDVDPL